MNVLAFARTAAAALLLASAAAPAVAQTAAPVTMIAMPPASNLINVGLCDVQKPSRLPAYNAYSPAFYPFSPYSWTDPYGYQFYQPAMLPTSGTLSIDYTNVTSNVMKTIDFGLVARGRLVAEVRDVGTFSPKAEIKHQFGLNPNVFPLRTALFKCLPLHIVYADGTTWKNPQMPRARKEIYKR